MTNSCPSSVLKGACLAALAAIVGCGGEPPDGKKEYAEGEAAYAVRDFAKAERGFTDCLKYAPSNVDALLMLARTRLDLGKIAEAREAIAAAEALAGGDCDVLLLSGQAAFHARDYEKAVKAFRAVAENAELAPAVQAQGWAGLGVVQMAMMSVSQSIAVRDVARTDFLRAIKLDGRNASARYNLGVLYKNAFSYNKAALDQFEIFVRLEKTADKRVQDVQQKTIPAIRDEIAAADARRDGVAKRDSAASAAALRKAEAAWAKGTFKTAKLRYGEAYAADVLSYPAALGLAKAWEKTDTTQAGLREALKYYCIASSLRPSSKDIALKAGDLAYKLGSYAPAVEAYSHALAASPNDITVADGLIRALQKSGNSASARAYQRYRDWVFERKK